MTAAPFDMLQPKAILEELHRLWQESPLLQLFPMTVARFDIDRISTKVCSEYMLVDARHPFEVCAEQLLWRMVARAEKAVADAVTDAQYVMRVERLKDSHKVLVRSERGHNDRETGAFKMYLPKCQAWVQVNTSKIGGNYQILSGWPLLSYIMAVDDLGRVEMRLKCEHVPKLNLI